MVRLAFLLVMALLAYAISLQFIFPGYIALPAPFHNDMYWALKMAHNGLGFLAYLRWPRPVFFETLFLAGHFGLEGSLVFLATIVVFDLALALLLLERFVLRYQLPWWLALGSILLMMAGPGFYAQPAFDVGYHLALLFGFLGIYAWEAYSSKNLPLALLLTGVCFTLCTLANEGFVPALLIYGALAALRERHVPVVAAAAFAMPAIAVACAFVDGQLTHSPFVAVHAAAKYPYRIDLSPQSLAVTARFYLGSLVNPAFLFLLLASVAGLYYNLRLQAAAVLLVAGLSLYIPYLVLPNHLTDIYRWAPMPLFGLIVPLAWIRAPRSPRERFANAALLIALAGTLGFQTTQYRDDKHSYATTLEQNRNMIAALRAHADDISQARNVLVRGLTFVNDPWAQNADVVNAIVPNFAEWSVETEPGYPAIVPRSHAVPIAANAIEIDRYDLVLDFDPNGNIASVRKRLPGTR